MIVIVTDSTACLNRQEAERLGVTHVPMTYTLDGVTHREHFVEENGDYIARIEGAKTFATSQPPIDTYLKTFAELRQAGHQVLCLSISSRLSGTYANEVVCAREVGSEDIRVVDTLTTAGGLYIMVRAARQFLDAGYSLSETAEKLEQMRGKVKTLFSVGDMEPLRRSGRLGPVRQSVCTVLNVRPLLTCREGAVMACGLVRGKSEQIRALAQAVPTGARGVVVQYIKDIEAGRQLQHRLESKLGQSVMLRPIGPVLAIHLGVDIIGVAWLEP